MINKLAAVDRKLVRDLWHIRGQVLTIALIIACGIASFVTLRGTFRSLEQARAIYYERHRFADAFIELKAAPLRAREVLKRLKGVARVDVRVAGSAMLPLDNVLEPIRARVISLPQNETLNVLQIREGRKPLAGHPDETVILDGFAKAHKLKPGSRIPAVINGRQRMVTIVGTALSPEFILAFAPGAIAPNPERFAVLWFNTEVVEAAYRKEAAFTYATFQLDHDASTQGVLNAIDNALETYGGTGAYARDHQPSHRAVDGELAQLKNFASVLPAIFLGVAALLVSIVLARLVQLQQSEIAMLKAMGYRNAQIGAHFVKLVLVLCVLGTALGLVLGVWLGRELLELYERFFKFPSLQFEIDPRSTVLALAFSVLAALGGALGAVRRAVNLPPAEALRPPSPEFYRPSLLDRLKIAQIVGPTVHMVARELQRRPLRALLSSVAIAASTGLTVIGGWYYDGIEHLMELQFQVIMREDLMVSFIEPRRQRAVRELAHLPGVLAVEGLRAVPVRFRSGHRYRDAALWGYPERPTMRQLRDKFARSISLPPDGIILTETLAKILQLKVGDNVELELYEGSRGKYSVRIVGLVDESVGLQGHMRQRALSSWFGDEGMISVALLRIDPLKSYNIHRRLKDMPFVMEVTRRQTLIERFHEQSASMMLTTAMIITLFAVTITIGVVYNNARVMLSMRGRDLATLRVLGFTRGEISAVLLGELATQVIFALPFGLWFGRLLITWLAATTDPETWRLPVIVTDQSYAFAAAVTLTSALLSALLVRRRLDHLDLVAVLKTRE